MDPSDFLDEDLKRDIYNWQLVVILAVQQIRLLRKILEVLSGDISPQGKGRCRMKKWKVTLKKNVDYTSVEALLSEWVDAETPEEAVKVALERNPGWRETDWIFGYPTEDTESGEDAP